MKHAKTNRYRRQRQHERKRAKRQAKQKSAPQRGRGQELVYQIYQTIQHFFPELFEQMRELAESGTQFVVPIPQFKVLETVLESY